MAGNLPSLTVDTTLLEVAGTITGAEVTTQDFENEFDMRSMYLDTVNGFEYWGGSCTLVGTTGHASQFVLNNPVTRHRLFAVDTATSTLQAWNPNASNTVYCITPGPAGKLFVAGGFSTINGVSRSRIALIGDATGSPTVDTTFVPGTIDARITGLAYDAGAGVVYISGIFTSVGGTGRAGLACLDSTNASLKAWNPGVTGSTADCRRVILGVHSSDQTDVYVAGEFTAVNGVSRLGLAAVAKNPATASPAVAAWNPDLTGTSSTTKPHDVAITPDGTTLVIATAGTDVSGDGNKGICYTLVVGGSLSRQNTRNWATQANGDGGDHNACACDNQYAAFGHHGDGSKTASPGTDSKKNHKIYLVNIADGSSTTWVPTVQPNSVQGTYAIRLYDDRMLVGSVWTQPRQGIARYTRAGTGGGGGGGGGGGWLQVYESRMPLGGAAKTNYGAGQQGRTLYHQTQTTAGASPVVTAPTWGYGKFAAVTLALTTGSDITPPTIPLNLVATATGSNTASLTWNPSTDASGVAGYTVYRDGAAITTVITNAYNDSGLTPGTTYSYTVDAFDANGNHSSQSSASSITTTTMPDTQPPTIPGSLAATITGSSVSLSWTASTDNVIVAGYRVTRNGVVIAPTVTNTTYVDAAGTPGVVYTYSVSAFDAVPNRSGESNTQTVTYPAAATGAGIRGNASGSTTGPTTNIGGFAPNSATQVGDLIIATVRVAASAVTITAPTGWTSINISTPGNMVETMQTFWKIYAATDNPSTWLWTWSGGAAAQLSLLSLKNAIGIDNSSKTNINGGAVTLNAVTLANASDFLFFVGTSPAALTGTIGAGFTTLEPPGLSSGIGIVSGYINPATSGTNGPFVTGLSGKMVGQVIGVTAGNTVVTNVGPTLTVTSPANGVSVNSTTVGFQAVTTDADGIASVVVNTISGPVTLTASSVDAAGNGTYVGTVPLLTSASPGSQNDFTVTSTDANAVPLSTTSPTISVFGVQNPVDTTPPTLVWDTPAGGTNASLQGPTDFPYAISFRATDPSGLGAFTIDVPGFAGLPISPDNFGNFLVDVSLVTGANAYTLHTADVVGNTASVSFTITLVAPDAVDTTGPTVTIATPVGTFTVVGPNGTIYAVNGVASDPSGITSVTVNGVTQTLFTDTDTGSVFHTSITLATGNNSLQVIATDASPALNTTTVNRTIVLEDTAGPTIIVITPAATAVTITGDPPFLYEVSGTVTSANGLSLFTVDSVPVTVATDGSWAEVISLDLGLNNVVIQAVDSANNPTILTYEITLEPEGPGSSSAFNLSTDQARVAERLQNRGTE